MFVRFLFESIESCQSRSSRHHLTLTSNCHVNQPFQFYKAVRMQMMSTISRVFSCIYLVLLTYRALFGKEQDRKLLRRENKQKNIEETTKNKRLIIKASCENEPAPRNQSSFHENLYLNQSAIMRWTCNQTVQAT